MSYTIESHTGSVNGALIPIDQTADGRAVQTVDAVPYRDAERALGLWLASYASPNTKRAYRRQMQTFAAFAGHNDVVMALSYFLALEDGPAHAILALRRNLSGGCRFMIAC